MYLFGCSMCYGVNADGLKNSVEYLQSRLTNKLMGIIDISLIDILECCEKTEVYNLKLKNLYSVLATCDAIAQKADSIIKKNEIPLFIGGDHSSVIGTVSASSNYYDNLGLIWIDAHPDINTDKTTVSGNIHGMTVAALLGMGEKKLTRILNEQVKLKPENIVMFGLRDIDPPEKITLDRLNIKYFTYNEMKIKGIKQCLDEAKMYLGKKDIHVSIDIDSMNPDILSGVSVPVKDGFDVSEMNYILSYIKSTLNVIAWDIVEFNHDYDVNDKTADYILELIRLISVNEKEIET